MVVARDWGGDGAIHGAGHRRTTKCSKIPSVRKTLVRYNLLMFLSLWGDFRDKRE